MFNFFQNSYQLGRGMMNDIGLIRLSLRTCRLLFRTVGLSLLLALAACGGNDESISASSAAAGSSLSAPPIARLNLSSLQSTASNNRFIVKYRNGTVERSNASFVQRKLDRASGSLPARAKHLRRLAIGADVITVDHGLNRAEAESFMRQLATDPGVDYIEADVEMHTTMVPNDSYYGNQWGYGDRVATGDSLGGIRDEGAWDISNGAGMVVADLDNGITRHSDLDANVLPGIDFLDGISGGDGSNLGIPYKNACFANWHGTQVTGVLAAVTNNGNGIAGTAWGAQVVPVRIFDGCGHGLMSDVAQGVVWASGGTVDGARANAHPAQVINMSLSAIGSCSFTMQNAIDSAVSRGTTVVVAAGNYNDSSDYVQPANCRNIIAVAANDVSGQRAGFSEYGRLVDISAPGVNIFTTSDSGMFTPGGESYAYLSGTSLAAPYVAGVVALMQSVAPKPLTPGEVRSILMRYARAFPVPPDQPIGTGILDASAAVTAAKSGVLPPVADLDCVYGGYLEVTCTDTSTFRSGLAPWRYWDYGNGLPAVDGRVARQLYIYYESPGTYYISLRTVDRYGATSTITRAVEISEPKASAPLLTGQPVTGLAGDENETLYYAIDVPAGANNLTLRVSGGTGRASLYVRRDNPTLLNPLCEATPEGGGRCTFPAPEPGRYYVMVSGLSGGFSDVTLAGNYAL
jgi:serine protease